MKTNTELLEYAKAQVGKPYWWGCFGQVSNASLLVSKRGQYPAQYAYTDFKDQMGVKVHDCVGLIKGALWCEDLNAAPVYNPVQDVTAAGMYLKSTERGTMDSWTNKTGVLVYKGNSPKNIYHIGIYGGDGFVYHAKGHMYGVVKEKFFQSQWTFWSQCPWAYDDSKTYIVDVTEFPTISRGEVGAWALLLQQALTLRGYPLSCDGDFGPNTEKVVKVFQKDFGLEVDGVVGYQTWRTLFV